MQNNNKKKRRLVWAQVTNKSNALAALCTMHKHILFYCSIARDRLPLWAVCLVQRNRQMQSEKRMKWPNALVNHAIYLRTSRAMKLSKDFQLQIERPLLACLLVCVLRIHSLSIDLFRSATIINRDLRILYIQFACMHTASASFSHILSDVLPLRLDIALIALTFYSELL